MKELKSEIKALNKNKGIAKADIVSGLRGKIEGSYEIVQEDSNKPWGAYFRLNNTEADRFVSEFFPGLTPDEARMGIEGAELSPKILLVSPSQRLSWQYHFNRAERWAFLTEGSYYKSIDDEPGEAIVATEGDVVQFDKSERHRLVGVDGAYTVVAEIWQHVDPQNLSSEDDIVRLQDDYKR